jgi:hypothetical protein
MLERSVGMVGGSLPQASALAGSHRRPRRHRRAAGRAVVRAGSAAPRWRGRAALVLEGAIGCSRRGRFVGRVAPGRVPGRVLFARDGEGVRPWRDR